MGRVSTIGTKYYNPMVDHGPSETPGPGAYSSNSPIGRQQPKQTIPRAQRKSTMVRKSDTLVPGVGIYTPKTAFAKKKAPGYSLGKRIESKRCNSNSPGPAAYQPQNASARRAVSIPRERRLVQEENSPKRFGSSQVNLGPGQYQLTSIFEQQRHGHKFTKAANRRSPKYVEQHEKQRRNNPGPGSYSQTPLYPKKLNMSQKRLTQLPKNASLSKLQVLGGNSSRNSLGLSQDKLDMPGPADYDGRGPSLFEKMQRRQKKSHTALMFVTPHNNASKRLLQSQSSVQNISTSSRNSSFEKTPGPGQYEVAESLTSTERNKRITRIGGERRFRGLFKIGISPGPIYMARDTGKESSHRTLPKISFTKQQRFSKKQDKYCSQSPSPSTYNLPTPRTRNVAPIMQDLTQYDHVLTALRESKIKGPGPQSYNYDAQQFMPRQSPKIQIGKQGRFQLLFNERTWRENPGPGDYCSSAASSKKGRNSATTKHQTFSKSQRKGIEYLMGKDKDLLESSPGPGSYRLPKMIGDIPKYQLPRIQQRRVDLNHLS